MRTSSPPNQEINYNSIYKHSNNFNQTQTFHLLMSKRVDIYHHNGDKNNDNGCALLLTVLVIIAIFS